MPVLPDHWIRRMALEQKMIEPFAEKPDREGVISYGLSAYGYDMRIADEFQVFHGQPGDVMDPKNVLKERFIPFQGAVCEIPPNSIVLARSLEYFRIPRDVLAICFGKSTYARSGIVPQVTPLEPEWEGYVTMAITNLNPYPARIYAHEGMVQVVFLQAEDVCAVSYKDKKGKYQAQQTITHSKL